ncbi:MAG: hypothetical protein IH621_10520, partial [Krumholzibacteria bacterium]|nr:hypothetical protein [Candidatus Krumholzibacteria bacterium]
SPVAARAWQLMAADFAANVSTRPLVVPVLLLALLAMMLWFGYADMGDEADFFFNQVWMVGLVYQWALFPLFSLAPVLLTPPRTDVSRRSGLRAEVAALGGTALVSGALALATAAVFLLLEAVLPPLPWRGEALAFRPGAAHGIWLVPLVTPFVWLAVALRPRPQNSLANAAIMFPYFAGHILLTAMPYAQSTPLVLAASLAAFVVAFLLRRRWWLRADLGL